MSEFMFRIRIRIRNMQGMNPPAQLSAIQATEKTPDFNLSSTPQTSALLQIDRVTISPTGTL